LAACSFARHRILRGIGFIDDREPLRQQQHYFFPLLHGELPKGIGYNMGSGVQPEEICGGDLEPMMDLAGEMRSSRRSHLKTGVWLAASAVA
jgi:hypothetical protein